MSDKVKTNLEYKEHSDFFEDYFIFKKQTFVLLSESITDQRKIPELYQRLRTLINYTSNYIPDIKEIDADLKVVDGLMVKDKKQALRMCESILRKLNDKHEQTAILPQKATSYDEKEAFWRNEESRAMKELKKAFYDVFMKQ